MSVEPSFSRILVSYNEAAMRLNMSSRQVAAYLTEQATQLGELALASGDQDFVTKLDKVKANMAAPSLPAPELAFAAYTLFSVAAHLSPNASDSNRFFAGMQELGMFGRANLPSGAPVWDGSKPVPGQTLVVTCADGQGVGDTLHLPALLREIKAQGLFEKVHLEVQPGLVNTLQGFPHADSVFAKGTAFPEHQMTCSLMMLPALLNVKLQDFRADPAYLKVPAIPAENAEWIAQNITAHKGPTIALAWKGDPNNRLEKEGRGMELQQLLPLLETPNARFVTLQFGPGSEQVAQLPAHLQEKFISMPRSFDPGKEGFGFRDTLAVMAACDATVSTDTSIIHAAGAIGARGFSLIQHIPEGRWGTVVVPNSTSASEASTRLLPWYSNVTAIIQPREGDWDSVAQKVAKLVGQLNTVAQPRPTGSAPSAA